MIWHVLLHVIGVILIILFTFVNTTAEILNISLAFFDAIATTLLGAVFALLDVVVGGVGGNVEAPYQV